MSIRHVTRTYRHGTGPSGSGLGAPGPRRSRRCRVPQGCPPPRSGEATGYRKHTNRPRLALMLAAPYGLRLRNPDALASFARNLTAA